MTDEAQANSERTKVKGRFTLRRVLFYLLIVCVLWYLWAFFLMGQFADNGGHGTGTSHTERVSLR